nr:hypothetical protein [Micromonospora aurantiaca]
MSEIGEDRGALHGGVPAFDVVAGHRRTGPRLLGQRGECPREGAGERAGVDDAGCVDDGAAEVEFHGGAGAGDDEHRGAQRPVLTVAAAGTGQLTHERGDLGAGHPDHGDPVVVEPSVGDCLREAVVVQDRPEHGRIGHRQRLLVVDVVAAWGSGEVEPPPGGETRVVVQAGDVLVESAGAVVGFVDDQHLGESADGGEDVAEQAGGAVRRDHQPHPVGTAGAQPAGDRVAFGRDGGWQVYGVHRGVGDTVVAADRQDGRGHRCEHGQGLTDQRDRWTRHDHETAGRAQREGDVRGGDGFAGAAGSMDLTAATSV